MNHTRLCIDLPPVRPSLVVLLTAITLLPLTSGRVHAQVAYSVVADLGTIGGQNPLGGVIVGADGALYGTASGGGANECGLVYRLGSDGALTTVHTFDGVNGCTPSGELVLTPDGSLLGTTFNGGGTEDENIVGIVYKIDASGAFSVLHRFVLVGTVPEPWLEVYAPYSGLTLGPDGFYYGTTRSADVFRISASGDYAVVTQFDAEATPEQIYSGLTVGSNGRLYGTSATTLAIFPSAGSIFSTDVMGNASVDHVFTYRGVSAPPPNSVYPEGRNPQGELVQTADGSLYAALPYGGPSRDDAGTIVRLAADGTLSVIHAFSPNASGAFPNGSVPLAGVTLGSDGAIYGTTSSGGDSDDGVIYRITPAGDYTVLRSFAQDGYQPIKGRLLETSPGIFFGTAPSDSGGVVYRLALAGGLVSENLALAAVEDSAASGTLVAQPAGELTFSIVANGSRGTATLTDPSSGAFTYVPKTNAFGTDTFTFRASRGGLQSNVATVTVTIAPVNDSPVANAGTLTVNQGGVASGALTATDIDSPTLTYAIVANGTKGAATITDAATGAFTYSAASGQMGADIFSFQVSDGGATSNVAEVAVTIGATTMPLTATLISPLDEVKLFADVLTTITWTASGASRFDILFSRDGGNTFEPVLECMNLPGTATSCPWTPFGPRTGRFGLLQIRAFDAEGRSTADVSHGLRLVEGSPRLKVTTPTPRVVWAVGETQPIWWTHNLGPTARFRLELSRDAGATWQVLADNLLGLAENIGAYEWTVSGPPTSDALLRISDTLGFASDATNREFRIIEATR